MMEKAFNAMFLIFAIAFMLLLLSILSDMAITYIERKELQNESSC